MKVSSSGGGAGGGGGGGGGGAELQLVHAAVECGPAEMPLSSAKRISSGCLIIAGVWFP